MEIAAVVRGEVVVVEVAGRLDLTSAPAFEARVFTLMEEGRRLFVIDLARLGDISSAGLRSVLITARKLQPSGGRILLAAPNQHVRSVLEISGFSTIFEIYPSADEALARAAS